MMRFLLIALIIIIISSCSSDNSQYYIQNNPYSEFESISDFRKTLVDLTHIRDEKVRDSMLSLFVDSLRVNKKIPFVKDTSVIFLYFGNADKVSWIGDFNKWNSRDKEAEGRKLEPADIWIWEKTFEYDAGFDYRVLANDTL